MNNWVKMTNDEMEVGIEIATLKKGELQIKYAKDIVAKNKEIERLNNIINELDKETYLGTIENQNNNDYSKGLYTAYKYTNDRIKELKGVDKE